MHVGGEGIEMGDGGKEAPVGKALLQITGGVAVEGDASPFEMQVDQGKGAPPSAYSRASEAVEGEGGVGRGES